MAQPEKEEKEPRDSQEPPAATPRRTYPPKPAILGGTARSEAETSPAPAEDALNGQAGERAEGGEQTRELVVTLSLATGEVTRIEHLEKDGRRREFTPEEYAATAAYYAGASAAPVTPAAAAAEPDAALDLAAPVTPAAAVAEPDAAFDLAAYDPYGYARAYAQGAGNASTGTSAAAAAYTTDQVAYFQGALDASTALASLAAAYAAMPAVRAYYQGIADFMAART